MMSAPVSLQNKIGACPHGLPQSSCPICSKQTGSASMANSPIKNSHSSGEWSYQKCYAAGLEIKAAMQRKENAQAFYEKQFQTALQFNKNIQNIYDKLTQFVQNIKSPNIQNSMQFLLNTVVNPFVNVLSQISKFVEKMSQFQQKTLNIILQAGEKVVNIIGEIKNFVERKIIDDLKKKAKKFMLFCLSVIEEENYQNDDTLAVFKSREMKKYSVKINDEHRNNKTKQR